MIVQERRVGAARHGLFDWARTSDEDVHQPPRALLPARAGRYMGDTDQRSKQVEGVEISANVAALDRAFYQRINRSMDQPARTLI